MRRKLHHSTAHEDEEIQVEVLQGEWADALTALHGFRTGPNVKPLAALLKRGGPVPEEVLAVLGQLLDPPWGDKGPRLVLNDPPRWSHARAVREIGTKRKLRSQMLGEYERVGSKKLVIANFAKQTRLSESYLKKCWELDNRKTVIEIETIFAEGVKAKATRKRSIR